jgi:hypothetical protein
VRVEGRLTAGEVELLAAGLAEQAQQGQGVLEAELAAEVAEGGEASMRRGLAAFRASPADQQLLVVILVVVLPLGGFVRGVGIWVPTAKLR